ncbi:DUF7336 domain-containing protein [Flavobacterium reichenbachii]|uniref:DUF7336 domain-containing protein n=1 Tax=Flavobacterium reichenbachii TaxID=362418 RepID=A0A085ZCQ1_9FLAO|nr:hypothetical protein [Flavobacterium reichenbachii]KFF02215.1 hypothetical protein IW19_24840 [Flavobacterium reichenbachii]OXB11430.1 hypothetical protein B0A68_21030 [Flavobacterium reichenbachii]
MREVYILQHSYDIENFEEIKIIGIYSTLLKAEETINRYKDKKRFIDYPIDCFSIDKYKLDADNWTEGFVNWEEANEEV